MKSLIKIYLLGGKYLIGIIILNYINWEVTLQCIKSILETSGDINIHIYLIDNASPNPPPKQILELEDNDKFTFIKNNVNKGYSAGNNVGIKRALNDNCSEILITNSDIIFLKDTLTKMQEYLKINTEVGIVGPKLINLEGNVEAPSMLIKTGLKEKYLVRTGLRKIFKSTASKYYCFNKTLKKPLFVHSVSGSCFMMSRECALKITPLDENTFLFQEELIIGVTMENTGKKTVYLPEASVIHAHGQSTKSVKAFSFISFVRSEIYYCKKYLNANFIELFPLYLIRTISYCVRALKYEDFRKNFTVYYRQTIKDLIRKY